MTSVPPPPYASRQSRRQHVDRRGGAVDRVDAVAGRPPSCCHYAETARRRRGRAAVVHPSPLTLSESSWTGAGQRGDGGRQSGEGESSAPRQSHRGGVGRESGAPAVCPRHTRTRGAELGTWPDTRRGDSSGGCHSDSLGMRRWKIPPGVGKVGHWADVSTKRMTPFWLNE